MAKKKKEDLLFVVMKMQTTIEVKSLTGKTEQVQVSGAKGYMPVFDNLEKAEEHSCDGKYTIYAAILTEEKS